MDPKGRVAVVTGGAGGIGSALTRGLIAAGSRAVVVADLRLPEIGDLGLGPGPESPDLGGGAPGQILLRQLDATDEDATRALIAEVEGSVGPIDLWFANAGLAAGGGPEVPDATWERLWQVNVMAHVIAARLLLPGWLTRGGGHLVVTASMAGLLTTLGDSAYSTTKHAAVGFAEWLAITYGDQGVRVSCLCPGAVDTAMLRELGGGDAAKGAEVIGGGELLTADEVAARALVGVIEDRFLIFTHTGMHEFTIAKAQDPDRWIRGMRRLWARTQTLLRS
jgi:NAD(P)-dependent dehydrogenase (short-subunit alcohol dehydrogenase family)